MFSKIVKYQHTRPACQLTDYLAASVVDCFFFSKGYDDTVTMSESQYNLAQFRRAEQGLLCRGIGCAAMMRLMC